MIEKKLSLLLNTRTQEIHLQQLHKQHQFLIRLLSQRLQHLSTTLYVNIQSTQGDSFQVDASNNVGSYNICPTSTNACIVNLIITLQPTGYNNIIITNKNAIENANIVYYITVGSGGNYGFIFPNANSIWTTPGLVPQLLGTFHTLEVVQLY